MYIQTAQQCYFNNITVIKLCLIQMLATRLLNPTIFLLEEHKPENNKIFNYLRVIELGMQFR